MKKRYIIHVLTPLIMGGLLYILFRDNNLKMFNWFSQMGIAGFVDSLRFFTLSFKSHFPSWLFYSLPDALWTYSLTVFMILNFNRRIDYNSFFWISLGPFISIGMELSQSIGLLKGTFDIIDLILCIIASILSLLHIVSFKHNYFYKHEQKNYIIS